MKTGPKPTHEASHKTKEFTRLQISASPGLSPHPPQTTAQHIFVQLSFCLRGRDKNLQHACSEMAGSLNGEEAFGFPMSATTVPFTGEFSAFCEIDEEGLQEYRDSSGGCSCKTGCGNRCGKCRALGRPCTWRCSCKGKISVPTRHSRSSRCRLALV